MRFIKQREEFSCGPVVIINALRWAGEYTPIHKYFVDICQLCKCSYARGSSELAFDWVLRNMGEAYFTTRRVTRPTLKQVEDHLRAGGIVVMNTREELRRLKDSRYGNRQWYARRHLYILADVSDSGTVFEAFNRYPEGPISQPIFRQQLKNEFRRGRKDRAFKAWFLNKK